MHSVDIWLVVGFRRWARLMVQELCALLPQESNLYMQSDKDNSELLDWLFSNGLDSRVHLVDEPPICSSGLTGVAFVVNSAYLHSTTIHELLCRGYHVVSEKPIAFTLVEAINLQDLATKRGLYLFSVNTYQFSRSLHLFRDLCIESECLNQIGITWSDPSDEIRYGQKKGYDSSVPIIYDVIPHIANILLVTIGFFTLTSSSIHVMGGGSIVHLNFKTPRFDIHINLQRNALSRKRLINLFSDSIDLALDFSADPYYIHSANSYPGHFTSSLSSTTKPISTMLKCVYDVFATGKIDSRLSLEASLFSNYLIDLVSERYVSQQISFVASYDKVSSQPSSSSDYEYTRKEIHSIATRAFPYLPMECPLNHLLTLNQRQPPNSLL